MPRYRVMTPDTQRVPDKAYGDFEFTQECDSPICVRHLLEPHDFTGCCVWRQHRKHWELIFDSTSAMDALWWVRWNNVEINQ